MGCAVGKYRRSILIGCMLLATVFVASIPWTAVAAKTQTRLVTLTFLPDFANNSVDIYGTILPGDLSYEAAQLAEWGLGEDVQAWKSEVDAPNRPWNVQGTLDNAEILEPTGEDGFYHLRVGPLSLQPGDTLLVIVPFANLRLEGVTPPPDNLHQLLGPDVPILLNLEYVSGNSSRELMLGIPFRPAHQEIDLVLTPLIGEALAERHESFRLSGQVIYDGLEDYREFERHCNNEPGDTFFRYRVAHALFALDYPPAFHFGFLNPAYRYKPTYSLLRSDVLSCEYRSGVGRVEASFAGRVLIQPQDQNRFPDFLESADVTERHVGVPSPRGATGQYEIVMGEVLLGPEDILRIAVPDTNVLGASPPPSQFVLKDGQTQIEYVGPQRFELRIRYAPRPVILFKQLPTTLRTLVEPVEQTFGMLFGRRADWQTWLLLAVGLALALLFPRTLRSLDFWVRFAGWFLVSAALFFGLRQLYGWMALAAVFYIQTSVSSESGRRRIGAVSRGLIVLGLVALFMVLDTRAERLFDVLSTVELDLTALTPVWLSLLALLATAAVLGWGGAPSNWTPRMILPFALFLFALSIYDVLQKSLLSLVLAGLWGGWVAYRMYRSTNDRSSLPDDSARGAGEEVSSITKKIDLLPGMPERFAMIVRSPILYVGIVVLIGFSTYSGLNSTASVFGPGLGILRFALIPVLLVVSVTLAFVAIGSLFVLLYPMLPFNSGYLKALVFGFALWTMFILGVGGDDRLVTSLGGLLLGRLVYYLAMPLLLGLYFEAVILTAEQSDSGESTDEERVGGSIREKERRRLDVVKQLFGGFQNWLGTFGTLFSLVAPAAYAAIFGQPFVTTYFDLMDALIAFSVALG